MGLIFHRGRGPRGPLVRGKTAGEQFLRLMLLIAVFSATGYAFWWNNTRVIEAMSARSSVYDPGKALAEEERQALHQFVGLFKDEFGMALRIVIAKEDVALPELDSKTVFVGVNPISGQILVDLPPLAARALGPDFAFTLQNDIFPPLHAQGEWEQGLLAVLKTLWDALLTGAAPAPPSTPDTPTRLTGTPIANSTATATPNASPGVSE